MDTLDASSSHGGRLEFVESLIWEESETESVSGVFLFSNGPVSVIIIDAVEIVVKILIDFNVCYLDLVGEPSGKVLVDLVSE
jgi:hypothetical protein